MADRFVFPPGSPSPAPAAAPLPPPSLAPQPATVARPAAGCGSGLVSVLLIAIALGIGCDVWLRWHSATPTPTTNDPVAAGKAYGATIAKDWADALDASASVIATPGTSVLDSQKAFQSAFDANRKAGFNRLVTPTWTAIYPEGVEITDANRAGYAGMLRATAKGARGQ